ncbi:uncharacterized protein LOC119597309 [Penaeus monodon]|uniref:uncharacterized protein LOC119597309 n=1 Tax=Penaeus monodon TaxID=6687 RepID=UPI0018A7B8DD|nr:uncharacterized protein LOC119597309 [Penaeus monodon]
MSYEEIRCGCFWENLPYCARALGVATAVVLWGVGVDMVYHHHNLGAYILMFSITLLFLEITWVVTLFLTVCVRNESSRVFACWGVVLWLDTWKKALLYWTFASLLLIKPHTLWLTGFRRYAHRPRLPPPPAGVQEEAGSEGSPVGSQGRFL